MSERERDQRFWWRHAGGPLLAFLLAIAVIAVLSADARVARALFFDEATGRWIGANAWWANELMHTGGRWLIRLVALGAIVAAIVGTARSGYAHWRRPAVYLALAIILSTGLVGLLKSMTNVDCPVDLKPFGGDRPYVGLLSDRPDNLPHARCFPAAHASSGYALLALYFLFAESHRRRARLGLNVGIGLGLLFGLAQQARGAHFLSHDLWSALIVWLTCLSLYVYGFGRSLARRPAAERGGDSLPVL